jgi:CubicO group peptidase (beta-lactamase class C family)
MKFWIVAAAAAMFATAASAGVTTDGDFRIEYPGAHPGNRPKLDAAVENWMLANNIHAAQLAVRNQGVLIVSHAYTMGAANPLVTTTKVFRLASNSKMLVTAAYSQLVAGGKLTGNELVYPFLGVTKPLFHTQTVDPRSNSITVFELEEHTGGLHGATTGDPLFTMRDAEVQLGTEPLTAAQFNRYLYGLPLVGNPGDPTPVYSNIGYYLLGQVVAKAAGMPYAKYVQQAILNPLGQKNWFVAATRQSGILPSEVLPEGFATNTGPSVFDLSANPAFEPFNFEGGNTIWELDAAPADMMTSAESLSAFIHTWNVYGVGHRAIDGGDRARDGCLPGVATWSESLNTDVDFALLFSNTPCLGFDSTVIQQIDTILRPL